MTLTRKTFLLLFIVTALSFTTAVVLQRLITSPLLKELDARADRKDVERVLTGFDAIRSVIHVLAYNYALDNDTYDYLSQHTPHYLHDHFPIDTFIGNNLDLVAFADRDGHVIWSKVANQENEEFYPDNYYDASELAPEFADARLAYPEAPVSKSGIVRTRLGPMIFSSYSVLHSDGSGDSPGSLLFGRLINNNTINEVQQLTRLSFVVSPLDAQQAAAFKSKSLNKQYHDENNNFDWYLADINGAPILKLHLKLQLSHGDVTPLTANTAAFIAFLLITLSWLVVVGYLNWSVVHPMLIIKGHLQKIRTTGDYAPRLGSPRSDEIGELSNECDQLIDHIEKQNETLTQQSSELRNLSLHDGLTGLSNRRHLDQLITDYWAIHQRERQPLSIIFCDIDHFKRYNDNYGHQAGDDALQQVANAILASLTRETDKAARYGGEEFALLLANTDELGVVKVAKRLQQELRKRAIPHEFSGVDPLLTLSIGCTTLIPDAVTNSRELLLQADQALYRAKGLGRNQIIMYNPDLA